MLPQARLATYVPELTGNPFGDATLEKNLDMEVAVAYSPSLPPDLGLFGVVGIVPRRAGAPDNIYDFLKTVSAGKKDVAADYWFYQNGSPESVAWTMRRISGKSWAELAQERIWSRLAADDAYIQVDSLGTEMASGGLSTTLRDAARFADTVRRAHEGDASAGIPVQAVSVALQPRGNQAGFAKGRLAAGRPGYADGDYWYQVNDGDGSVEASGRFGQKIYINPRKELIVVKVLLESRCGASRGYRGNRSDRGGTQSTAGNISGLHRGNPGRLCGDTAVSLLQILCWVGTPRRGSTYWLSIHWMAKRISSLPLGISSLLLMLA